MFTNPSIPKKGIPPYYVLDLLIQRPSSQTRFHHHKSQVSSHPRVSDPRAFSRRSELGPSGPCSIERTKYLAWKDSGVGGQASFMASAACTTNWWISSGRRPESERCPQRSPSGSVAPRARREGECGAPQGVDTVQCPVVDPG